jgi:penicillin-binding protein 2
MAVLTAAVANGGVLYQPSLVKRLVSPRGEVLKEFPPRKVTEIHLQADHLDRIRKAMAGVIHEPGGTGHAARLWGITAAGKTGTAQVVALGKKGGRDHAWFVAFAPLESPELAMAIVMEHGGHGGEAAAPVARRIFEAYFQGTKKPVQPPSSVPEETEAKPAPEGNSD